MKKFISIAFLICMFSILTFGNSIMESIEVSRNNITVEVNGQILDSDNFLYNDRTYVQLNEISKKIGANISWNGETKTASVSVVSSDESISQETAKVNINEPIIGIDFDYTTIESITLHENNQYYPAYFSLSDSVIRIESKQPLDQKNNYELIILLSSGKKISQSLDLYRNIEFTYTGDFKLIYVPAYPEKGFNYGFYLTLPSDRNKDKYKSDKRYLLVEPNNTGRPSDDLQVHINEAKEFATKYNTFSIGEDLWLPRLIPTFPRPMTMLGDEYIYSHQLTRNTMYIEELIEQKKNYSYDYDFEQLIRVDKQLYNMIEYGKEILNDNGQKVEDKVFMWGFSASAGFVNGYVYLHPEQVKAAIYGGAPMLPLTTFKNEELFFPYGVSDYKKLTGKDFDIDAYNQVAKFIYIGTSDTNNPTLAGDIFNKEEKVLVNKVFHQQEYPQRWNIIVDAFIESEATAQIFEYIGAGHQTFYKSMGDDYKNFFNANRNEKEPVYLQPSKPSDVNIRYLGK